MNAPLLPLKPIERLGWMRHFPSLRCQRSCTRFTSGRDYAMRCETVKMVRPERRLRSNGAHQHVMLSGLDLIIFLTDDRGWNHRFLERPTITHPIVHSFEFLVEHFRIPEVPDVGTLEPDRLEMFRQRLRALET
jgi:hypothetical protein